MKFYDHTGKLTGVGLRRLLQREPPPRWRGVVEVLALTAALVTIVWLLELIR